MIITLTQGFLFDHQCNAMQCNDVHKNSTNSSDTLFIYYSKPMDIYLFKEAVSHVTRISRVIKQPQGNALLLGLQGTGRQSLARLATYIAEYELFEILLSRNYGVE